MGGGGVRRPSRLFDDHVGEIFPKNDYGRKWSFFATIILNN